MKMNHKLLLGAGLLLLLGLALTAGAAPREDVPRPVTKTLQLRALSSELSARAEAERTPLYRALRARTTGPQAALNADRDIELMGVDPNGLPRFLRVQNLNAAKTISTIDVWPGGGAGFALTGANTAGELAVWDGGGVRLTHQEFGGRVTQVDSPSATHYHATHVAGTMVAAGVDANAKGMSHAAYLRAYDWTDDESEMATAAAAGLMVSNHSYGYVAGWSQSSTDPYDWYWYGDVRIDPDEDPGFGFYYNNSRDMDQIMYDAPYYLICKSAGNDRNDSGPGAGEGHYYWNFDTGDWAWSTVSRAADGGADGYDTVPYGGTAKNILTVGAAYDLTSGWYSASGVQMATFSGWGPTDDGRIKPDVVANGISLRSTMDDADNSYANLSGTSMSTPNASGSLHLVAQHYRTVHAGQKPLASTLKAIAIHTADEAGANPGPDYSFGWGLLNIQTAAEIVRADSLDTDSIVEQTLTTGAIDTITVYSDGTEPLVATIAWTDPAGTVPGWSLDPTTRMLVNDLDLRIVRRDGGTVYGPWILDPASPASAATTGDNIRDNVEQVEIASPASGYYDIIVSAKGGLGIGQTYSLVQSGSTEPPASVALPYTDDFSADAGWISSHPADFSFFSGLLQWHVDQSYEQKFYLPLVSHTGNFLYEADVLPTVVSGDFSFIGGLANSLYGGSGGATDYEGVFVELSGSGGSSYVSVLQIAGANTYSSTPIAVPASGMNHVEMQIVGGNYRLILSNGGSEVGRVSGTLGYPTAAYGYIAFGGPNGGGAATADGYSDNLSITAVTTWDGSLSSAPTVGGVTFAQRTDGSGLVDIAYDLADADSPTVTVTLEASSDGGSTWTLSTASATGDVGADVVPGNGKSIVWDFAADNPGLFLPDCVVRVTAEDAP